jgi:ABC-2 type transport system ATP-binding protein
MTAPVVAQVTDLGVDLSGSVALEAVSLDATAGSIVAVVGGDGAGKSTLLRALVGRVRPSRGSVSSPPVADIGFLPAGQGCWLELTVAQNLAFVAGSHGLRGEARRTRTEALLAASGLTDARDRLAVNLSGGMRKKLAFCLAAVHRPRLLVLDEPSTGVDPVSRIELWRLMTAAALDGAAVVMATTYLDEAERADHVLALDHGRTLAAGDVASVLAAVPGTVVSLSSDSPYAERLDPQRSWRHGRERRYWVAPDSDVALDLEPMSDLEVAPDLEDALIVAALERQGDA